MVILQFYGIDALLRIISHFAFICLAFRALGSIRTDTFFKAYHTSQIRIFFILLSIVIGYISSSFFLELIQLSKNIFYQLLN